MAIGINDALQDFQVGQWATDLNSGFIDIYDGVQPADPADPPDGTLLVSIELDADAYGDPAAGAAAVPSPVSGIAVAGGEATYAQQRNAANTRWMYGSVSGPAGGGDVELSTTEIDVDDTVTITTSTITQPAS